MFFNQIDSIHYIQPTFYSGFRPSNWYQSQYVNIQTVKIQKSIKSCQKTQTLTNSRYESKRVPILRAHEYPICKVKMVMILEATDPENLDRIYQQQRMIPMRRRTILYKVSPILETIPR